MPVDAGTVKSEMILDSSKYMAAIAKAEARMDKFAGKMQSVGNRMTTIGKNLSLKLTTPLLALGATGLKVASDMEQAGVAFEVMLGSAEKAKNLMGELQEFAEKTPFEFPEIRQSAQSLLAFGVEAENIVPTLTNIGDVASGVGMSVTELAEIYGKAKVQGRLFAEDINQLTGRGIPIIGELAKQFGVAESKVKEMVEEGKVGFPDLEKAFQNLSGEGGRFNDMMVRQSDTLAGKFSSLKDIISQTVTPIIKTEVLPTLKNAIDQTIALVEKFAQLPSETQKTALGLAGIAMAAGPVVLIGGALVSTGGKIIGILELLRLSNLKLVAAKAADKAETIALNAMYAKEKAALVLGKTATIAKTAATKAGTVATKAAAVASKGLSAAIGFFTSPVGIAIAAFAALVAIGVLVYKNWDTIKKKASELWAKIKEVSTKIESTFKGLAGRMIQAGKDIIQGVIDGIQAKIQAAINAVKNFGSTLLGAFRSAIDSHSPSKLFASEGENIPSGVAKGVTDKKGVAVQAVEDMTDEMQEAMQRKIDQVDKLGDAIMSALQKQYEEQEALQTKALDREVQNAQKASDAKIAIYDKEYNEKLKLIDEEAYKRIQAVQDEIDAIDELTEWEEKRQEEQEYRDKIAGLQSQLALAATEEEKAKIQADIDKAVADRERKLELERRDEQKEALRAEIEEIRAQADEKKEQLQAELEAKKQAENDMLQATLGRLEDEKAAIANHFATLITTEALQAAARKLILEKNNDEIVTLLKNYNPHWQNAGQGFGESLITGLNNMKQSVAAEVQAILSIIEDSSMLDVVNSQYDDILKAAEGSKEEVTGETDKQTKEQVATTSKGTSDILTNWQTMTFNLTNNVRTTKTNVMNEINALVSGIQSKFDELRRNTESRWEAISAAIETSISIAEAAIQRGIDMIDEWNRTEPEVKVFKTIYETEDAGSNAQGTNFWRGGLTWVGEKGPELIALPQGTKIFSNYKSLQMARDAANSLNINTLRKAFSSVTGSPGASTPTQITQHIEIHSTEPLSPSEVARKNLQASRQLALEWGF